ncbi:MAG: alkaline phosphatase family protein [Acidimicrobiales bacterium]
MSCFIRLVVILVIVGGLALGSPRPSAGAQATQIDKVIVIVEQNHTFDSYFATYPGANRAGPASLSYDPIRFEQYEPDDPREGLSNGRAAALGALNGGQLDRFDQAQASRDRDGQLALTYRTRDSAPILWSIADNYVLFDNYFSSAFGGSLPNTMHLFAGDDHGLGSDSKASVAALSELDEPTVLDRLTEADESWKLYVGRLDELDPAGVTEGGYLASAVPTPSAIYWAPPLGMPRFWNEPELRAGLVDQQQFYRDAASGSLPAVSYVIPQPTDHPASSGDQGQVRLQSLLNAVIKSPDWERTAVFVVWDDWGGFADRVDPPTGFGFRVPMLMISPHVKAGHVSSVEHDHTSVLNFIADRFALEPFSDRQATANDFSDALASSPRSTRELITQHVLDPTPVGTRSQNRTTLLMYAAGVSVGLIGILSWGRRSAFLTSASTETTSS